MKTFINFSLILQFNTVSSSKSVNISISVVTVLVFPLEKWTGIDALIKRVESWDQKWSQDIDIC